VPAGSADRASNDAATCKSGAVPPPTGSQIPTGRPVARAGVDAGPATVMPSGPTLGVIRGPLGELEVCGGWGGEATGDPMEVRGEGAVGKGAGPGRTHRMPRVFPTVLPRHSNRAMIAVDVRPSILILVTPVTKPVAIASSARIPSNRVHVNADRTCLALAFTVTPTVNRASLPIANRRGGVRWGKTEGVGGGGGGGAVNGS